MRCPCIWWKSFIHDFLRDTTRLLTFWICSAVPWNKGRVVILFEVRGIVCDNASSSGLNLETAEITFGAWSDPEGHAARGITEFEIIHNQTGLADAVDIQAGRRTPGRISPSGKRFREVPFFINPRRPARGPRNSHTFPVPAGERPRS